MGATEPDTERARDSDAGGVSGRAGTPPCSRRSPCASKKATPGTSGSLSTSAPTFSSARTTLSHSATAAAGSGASSFSAGQRAKASPTGSPGVTEKASAAALTCPTTCGPPGDGPNATGRLSSSCLSTPPRAAATPSSNRASRTQTTSRSLAAGSLSISSNTNICSHIPTTAPRPPHKNDMALQSQKPPRP